VDARREKQLWRTKMADLSRGETMTMAPIVVKGKSSSGRAGREMGCAGGSRDRRRASGKELWRGYSTGSDSDVKVGSRFKAFYPRTTAPTSA
jgi:hypothetical protein